MTCPATTMDLAQVLRAGFAQCPATVFVVTSRGADGTPHGATVTSVTSVSMSPPQVLVCLGTKSSTLGGAMASGRLALHALAGNQERVAQEFASGGCEKFRRASWSWSGAATPLLPDVLVRFECVVSQTMAAADHVVIVADVIDVDLNVDHEALVRLQHRYG